MNRKSFFRLSALLSVVAVLFTACPRETEVKPVDGSSIALYGNYTSYSATDINCIGLSDGEVHEYAVASLLSGPYLTDNGTEIIGVRFYVGDGAVSGKAFLGMDYENPSVEKEFTYKKGGWQYVLFDEPYGVTGEDIYVGYSISGSGYLLGFQSSNRNITGEMMYMNGKWATIKETAGLYGKWAVQAILRGGDYSNAVQHDIVLENVNNVFTSAIEGWNMPASFEVRNAGVKTAHNVKVSYSFGSDAKEITIDSLMNGQSYYVSTPYVIPSNTESITFSISAAEDGVTDEVASNNKYTANCTVTSADKTRNKALIEQFTSQSCGYCPGGATSLSNALDATGHRDYFVWVAHHAGYAYDDFTIDESKTIATSLNVKGAPNICVNRTSVAGYGLVWHPGYATANNMLACYAMPAKASLNVEVTPDEATGYKVKVTGTTEESEAYVTALVIQSGITAKQSSGGNSYVHNNFPVIFLTDAKGDKLTLADGGAFEATLDCTIPATFGDGNFATDVNNMEVVVFVHGNISSASSRAVYNADMKPLVSSSAVSKVANVLPPLLGASGNYTVAE